MPKNITETSIDETAPAIAASEPVDVEFSLDDWIEGISPTQRSVQIYGNTALFGRYEALQREIALLEQVAQGEDASVTDQDDLAALYAEREDLYARQQASKTTWYVQALDQVTLDAISKAHPVPDELPEPVEPHAKAPQAARDKYQADLRKYQEKVGRHEEKRRAARDEQNLHYIQAALIRIENHAGATVATDVTVEQLRKIQAKPHGQMQLGSLLTASFLAKSQEPVIPAPFSQANSRSAQS